MRITPYRELSPASRAERRRQSLLKHDPSGDLVLKWATPKDPNDRPQTGRTARTRQVARRSQGGRVGKGYPSNLNATGSKVVPKPSSSLSKLTAESNDKKTLPSSKNTE